MTASCFSHLVFLWSIESSNCYPASKFLRSSPFILEDEFMQILHVYLCSLRQHICPFTATSLTQFPHFLSGRREGPRIFHTTTPLSNHRCGREWARPHISTCSCKDSWLSLHPPTASAETPRPASSYFTPVHFSHYKTPGLLGPLLSFRITSQLDLINSLNYCHFPLFPKSINLFSLPSETWSHQHKLIYPQLLWMSPSYSHWNLTILWEHCFLCSPHKS